MYGREAEALIEAGLVKPDERAKRLLRARRGN
jgi:hypothetical protein